MDQTLINRVANSNLKLINLENFYPEQNFVEFDIKPFLFKELILKEKDFRGALKEVDWNQYKDKIVLMGYTGGMSDEHDVEDQHFTPMNSKIAGKSLPDMKGIYIHASILQSLDNSGSTPDTSEHFGGSCRAGNVGL